MSTHVPVKIEFPAVLDASQTSLSVSPEGTIELAMNGVLVHPDRSEESVCSWQPRDPDSSASIQDYGTLRRYGVALKTLIPVPVLVGSKMKLCVELAV
jgi:hypothetical protein